MKKIKVILALLGLGLLVPSICHATEWSMSYGDSGYHEGKSIQEVSTGGFIVAGRTHPADYYSSDLWVLKLNSDGSVDWQKSYGDDGTEYAYSIQEVSTGGYIVAGTNQGGWVLKLNSDGSIDWQKKYENADFRNCSIQEVSTGGYIVANRTPSSDPGGPDISVLKLNSDGSVDWQKEYGGGGTEYAYSIQEVSTGGFIVAGSTTSFGAGSEDAWVLKLNSDGSVDWQKTYGGSKSDFAYSIQEVSAGGYIVAGGTCEHGAFVDGCLDGWVLKLNPDGSVDWQKTYGQSSQDDFLRCIREVSGGGYIATGEAGDDSGPDLWVLKLGFDGSLISQRFYGYEGHRDGGYSVQEVSTGGYVVCGYTASFGAGGWDLWVLKLDEGLQKEIPCPLGTRLSHYNYSLDTSFNGVTSSAIVDTTNIVASDTAVDPLDTSVQPKEGCQTLIAALQNDTNFQRLRVYKHEPPDLNYRAVGTVLGFGDYENDNRLDLAGVDIDGDGVSEIAVIKRKLNGRQMLKIFRAPTRKADQLGSVIVSDSTFGNANKTSKKTHLAGVDIDGDGIDEIAVIEESLKGRQRLKIFQAPTAPGGQTGPPIASDLTFGNVNKNTRKIDLAGVDMDGDGIDEIAVIQQALNGKQSLRIFSAPTTTDAETGPCIASYNRFGNANEDTNKIIALTNVDIDGDGIDEIAVIRKKPYKPLWLMVYKTPATVGEGLGPPIIKHKFSNMNFIAITSLDP